MNKDIKKRQESSSLASGNIKGAQGTSGMPIVRRKKIKANQPYLEPGVFESIVAKSVLDNDESIPETVRPRGEQWVVYDDETGGEVQAFSDRKSAWKKQRLIRQAKNIRNQSQDKKQSDKKQPIKENMISYIFQQPALSKESVMWDMFMDKVPRETILSDQKMKSILENVAKVEAKTLGWAIENLGKNLSKHGFSIQRKNVEHNNAEGISVNFLVGLPESKVSLMFAVRLQNAKPTVVIPDITRNRLNSMGSDESKLLRAELMHIQETVLDENEDVLKEMEKRDTYLTGLSNKVEKVCKSLSPLEISLFRYIIKNKKK